MAKRPLTNKEYRRRLARVKEFVNLDFDGRTNLNRGQKAWVTRYYEELFGREGLVAKRPTKDFIPRSADSREAALQYASVPSWARNKMKKIPLPTLPDSDVRFRRGRLEISNGNIKEIFIPINIRNAFINPQAEGQRIRRQNPDIGLFQFQVGNFRTLNAFSPALMERKLIEMMGSGYSQQEKWLHGVFGLEFENQQDAATFLREFNRARERKLGRRKNGGTNGKKNRGNRR